METIQIEGDPEQIDIWYARTGCPLTGELFKSIFCPFRDKCVLPVIKVQAQDKKEARTFLEYAEATAQIPECLKGKTFLTRQNGRLIPFH